MPSFGAVIAPSLINVVSEIFKSGIVPMDTRLENIVWHKESKKW